MCGIAGGLAQQLPSASLADRVAAMQGALTHRGPDGGGTWIDAEGRAALAMRRLSIIDLAHGWQPLYNEDKTLVLVANGEIYNHVELRQELSPRHSFTTNSDCETILHLYEEQGDDCVNSLRGMFAFALFDMRRRRLLLARDRMGEKPLYLFETADGLLFASELKALLRSGQVPLELDPLGVSWFFHYGYPPEPITPIRGVRKLPAGHLLTVDLASWHIEERCYWRLEDAPPLEGDPVETVRGVLDEVARIVVRSDVPVGVALSGGLDSSVVAALAARTYPGTLQAFSVGYPGRPPCDERDDARALADHLGIPMHEVELDAAEMVHHFPELSKMRDDPIADPASWGYYAVMRAARAAGVPVMLQGQGGDELFWGYEWVRTAARENLLRADLAKGRGRLPGARLTRPPAWTPRNLARWVIREHCGLRPTAAESRRIRSADPRFLTLYQLIPDFIDAGSAPYAPAFRQALADLGDAADPRHPFAESQPWSNPAVATTRAICATYLLENGIAQGDRLSMAASVELRLPLIDYRLVETVIGLRKAGGNRDLTLPAKAWLREAVRGLLPDAVLRRPKRGFQPPVQEWSRKLFAAYGPLLADGLLVSHGVLMPDGARELARGGRPAYSVLPLSFKALTLEMWLRAMQDAVMEARS